MQRSTAASCVCSLLEEREMVDVLFIALVIGALLTSLVWCLSILHILRAWLEEVIDA